MISHQHQCIFIHQRKAAGTAIINAFGFKPADPDWHVVNDGILSNDWNTVIGRYPHYLVIAVIRNPWDRFISGWKYLPTLRHLSIEQVLSKMPVDGHDYRHLTRPQCDTLVLEEESLVVDVVLRFEHLSDDIALLSHHLRCDLSLQHLNATSNEGLLAYKRQEQIDAVATLFKKDIELFGYEFSTDTPGPTFCKHDFSKLGS